MPNYNVIRIIMAKQNNASLFSCLQEPFDSLHDNYLVELGDKEKELNRVLAKCDLPVLLCTLYEFIETNVRHREPREHDWE